MGWLEAEDPVCIELLMYCFNSTMGWLEERGGWNAKAAQRSFNSTMGWLEERVLQIQVHTYKGFNSTMGWLEVIRVSIIISDFMVSIPLWDDWKQRLKVMHHLVTCVSIPLWDDWKLTAWGMNPLAQSFNSTMGWLEDCPPRPCTVPFLFQFHYGMIGSLSTSYQIQFPPQFQFHYGMIGS